ncbi:glycosyltransferase 61 family protein [Pontivivens insulae]|uniref:Glycosyltransferase 61 catalytic domain-containing protein n=1 Tax=Pontivivens insulae TaxID=1639689 RepID=A0A2R8A7W3_9RHOB|nr:glycosyltransferase 61 family protein [Pontivivens insulae]RED18425.1 uncharacterized protein DUF563 [Pontivivens insulae]SPF28323.1 hypothetical protein POI8812_00621 [Pontivivens insulae]
MTPALPDPSVVEATDLLVLKSMDEARRVSFGLYDRDGQPMPNTAVGGVKYYTQPVTHLDSWPDGTVDGPERIFYGGHATDQFGFTILNSIGRLWALDRVATDVPILFHSNLRQRRVPFLRPMLDLLSVPNPILFYKGPFRVGSAVIPNDQFGEPLGGLATERFREWLASRLPPAGPVQKGRRVYLTRTALPDTMGRFACERILEQNLEANGYEIIAPETLSMMEQIKLYQDAETLLFSESSALHLYALVRRPEQKVGVVLRRRTLPPLITAQLCSVVQSPFETIDAIDEIYWPPKTGGNMSLAQLDFGKLHDVLSVSGFVSPKTAWRAPTSEEVDASLQSGLEAGQTLLTEDQYGQFLEQVRLLRRQYGRAEARKRIPHIKIP